MTQYRKALEIDPQSAEAFAALGLARWQIGQRDAGESALRQAVRLDENYIPAYLWLGGLLGDLGRLPEERQILQTAMVIDPLNELLAINFAGNLTAQGDYPAGKALLQDLLALKPDSATLLRFISGLAIGSGDLVDGWTYARQSYDLEPESPAIIEMMAAAWDSIGVTDKAEELLLHGMEIANDNAAIRGNYFALLLKQGRLEQAELLLKEQYGDSVDGLPEQMQQYYFFQKTLISLIQGNNDIAIEFLERALAGDETQGWDGIQHQEFTT